MIIDIGSVLHDGTIFEEPEKFKLKRNLEGDIALKTRKTIPFGVGRSQVRSLGSSILKNLKRGQASSRHNLISLEYAYFVTMLKLTGFLQ